MRIEKISLVEKVWPSKDSVSKRPDREEMVSESKKKNSFREELQVVLDKQNKKEEVSDNRGVVMYRTSSIETKQEQAQIMIAIHGMERKRDTEERKKKAEQREDKQQEDDSKDEREMD